MARYSVWFALLLLSACSTSQPSRQEREPSSDRADSCAFTAYDREWRKKLLIYHFYIGHGDATFVRTPSGTTVLIDAGLPGQGKAVILPTLKDCGIDGLDYAVLSHPHQDHFGGFADLLREKFEIRKKFYVSTLYDEKGAVPSGVWYKFTQLAVGDPKKKGHGLLRSMPAREFTVLQLNREQITDRDIVFDVKASGGRVRTSEGEKVVSAALKPGGIPKDANAVSSVIQITYGKFDYWTGGDITGGSKKGRSKPNVESVVARHTTPVEVFHVNHHGSETSNNADLLSALRPQHAVLSAGRGGVNGDQQNPRPIGFHYLPDYSAMRRILNTGGTQKIFVTSRGEPLTEDKRTAINLTAAIDVEYVDSKGKRQRIFDTTMQNAVVDLDRNAVMLVTDGDGYEFLGKGIRSGEFRYRAD
jgi:beta-lactamase superfamily II metal-dependent hydrolase